MPVHYEDQHPGQILCADEKVTTTIEITEKNRARDNEAASQQHQVCPKVQVHHTGKANHAPLLFSLRNDMDMGSEFGDVSEYIVQIPRIITRAEAEGILAELLSVLEEGQAPSVELAGLITLERLKVLSRDYKSVIYWWAKAAGQVEIAGWRDQVLEDLEEYRWMEKVLQLPETWSTHPAYTVWKDVEDWAVRNRTCEVVPKLEKLKSIFDDQEKNGVGAKVLQRLDDILDAVRAVDGKVDNLDKKVSNLDKKVGNLDKKLNDNL
jgi:hypothetical protein